MVLTMVSCGKDDDNNDDKNEKKLAGTVWVGYYNKKKVEGCALRFLNEATVYAIDWEYSYPGDEADSVLCTYTYNNPNGTINNPLEGNTMTFTVSGNSMQLIGFEGPEDTNTLYKIN